MKLRTGIAMSFLLLLLFFTATAIAQDSLASQKMISALFQRFTIPTFTLHGDSTQGFIFDSTFQKKLKSVLSFPDSNWQKQYVPNIELPVIQYSSGPFIKIDNGYISYNWTYRAGRDSSFIDDNVSQHLVTGSFNATIARKIPVHVVYFERQSNSDYFRDFRDVTVDFDVRRYRELKTQKALTNLKNSYKDKFDSFTPLALNAMRSKLDQYKNLLDDPKLLTELIRSKETLIRTDFPDTSSHYIDSVTGRARKFIVMYDQLKANYTSCQQLCDSLHQVYRNEGGQRNKLEQLLNNRNVSEKEIGQLYEVFGRQNESIKQLRKISGGLKKLAVGRTYPNYSNLTLQNINVNGINLEYAKGNYYIAATAGLVDFRIRDFLVSERKLPRQYVYAGSVGYGRREGNHLSLTYFRGRKQLFGGNLQTPSSDIQGVSVTGQFFIEKQIRVYAEIAQSGVPYTLNGNNSSKPSISLSDNSQRAYAVGVSSYLPRTQTVLEGYYQHSGLNYQSFNSFQYNATANSWAFRLDQSICKGQLLLQASLRRNDFVNPQVLQRYNGNTVFKNFTLSLRKAKWPLISAGYQPASQYTVVGNQVYENHYQAFIGNISHNYKLGIARGTTMVSVSQFFNDNRDSGLVYYNSKNFFIGQTFLFTCFTATVNVSGMNNGRHHLIVMEEGLSATFFKTVNAGFAIKINNLNKNINKIGFNAKSRIHVKRIGDLNVWMEQSYLPGLQQEFYRYEMYNIGFTRYFN